MPGIPFIKEFAFDYGTAMQVTPLIRRVVQAYGSRRCMWESDCPFQVEQATYDDSIALVRDRLDFLGADDRAWMLGRTAERLLFAERG